MPPPRPPALRVGMPETKARVLVSSLLIEDADPLADAKALDRLTGWMLQHLAPIAAADPPDGLVIDTTGADHLHGGEAAMLAGMIDRLAGSGIAARGAIADTWGAAHALARHAARPTFISPPGAGAAAIADLPVAALRIQADMSANLRLLGFEHIGDLLAQPRAPLALRFGPELSCRIDQALGSIGDPINPIRPPDLIETRRGFPEPIGAAETIARYIGELVDALCATLERPCQSKLA